ncbi:MAG: hypothetical protein FD144_2668 [Rhodospirillaceae bacterium]|nr:MAG: hypothetical protein FD144_2668 [Rhodospirillaceae bacterium]
MDPYAYARERTVDALAQWSTGTVTLTRTTPGTPDPSTPWIPGSPSTAIYTLAARVDGVAADRIDGTTILATDLMVIASPRATLAGAAVDLVPQISDTLSIDGAAKTIKKIEQVPAAGAAVRYHIFVAS